MSEPYLQGVLENVFCFLASVAEEGGKVGGMLNEQANYMCHAL